MNLKVKSIWVLLCLLLLLPFDGRSASTNPTLPASTVQIDPTIVASRDALPPLRDGAPRPVAALRDEKGRQLDFVENELVLYSRDAAAVSAFVLRWNGTILQRTDPPRRNPYQLKSIYLVRVNVGAVDNAQLVPLLAQLQPRARNDLKLSNQKGLKLLAAAAQERVNGLDVTLNYLPQPDQHLKRFDDLNASEAASANSGIGGAYSPNVFDWPYMNGAPQNINVTDAWRMLERVGKINKNGSSTAAVRIAIIDGGFCDSGSTGNSCGSDDGNLDFGPFNVDSDEFGIVNDASCTNGASCPWHGTNVAMAAAALPDNNFGAAGPAGPVARLMLYRRSALATGADAIYEAIDEGAKIINMSYGARFPASVAWVGAAFDTVTATANLYDVLLFSSAGNNGETVDGEDCLGDLCWEEAFYSPCENAGVICVGGLATASTNWHTSSNFGTENVNIWGPYRMYVGFDPGANSGMLNQAKNGTSFSSPFVAGVAALIWAANPSLSDHQVENILFDTAHKIENCITPTVCVKWKIVNASGAVYKALGNIPPDVTIVSPSGGAGFDSLDPVSFDAQAHDFNGDCCTYSWQSNKEGVLGTGSSLTYNFQQLGAHIITVTATDSQGLSASETIQIFITNKAPTANIITPLASDVIYAGSTQVAFKGEGFDQGGGFPGPMSCASLSWKSSKLGDILGNGCQFSAKFNSVGSRTITLTATDSYGAKGTDTVTLNVVALPSSGPPVINITKPGEGAHFDATSKIRLAYTLSDPGGTPSSQYTVVWKYKKVGGSSTAQVITPKTCTVRSLPYPCFTPADYGFNNNGVKIVDILLSVTDPEGFTVTDKVEILIGQVP